MKDVIVNELKNDWKSSAKKRKIRGQIVTELVQLIEAHDDLPVAAHLINILRSKGNVVGRREDGSPVYRDPFHMEDEVFLKELERHRDAMDNIGTDNDD